jgi:Hint-domain/VWA / Hh  protein intein-like/von Willebrand factor type A domain
MKLRSQKILSSHQNNQSDKMTTDSDNTSDEFVVVADSTTLPHHLKQEQPRLHPDLQIDSLPAAEGTLISIFPPKEPEQPNKRAAVDIVLVIDVSGSMQCAAPLPDTTDREESESTGLSILDLTKHAAKTILAPLKDTDRLGLVTFSTDAEVVQNLTYMNAAGKKQMLSKIEGMAIDASTNLWAGIKTGLRVCEDATPNRNIQSIFVLTDGMPNHMCPPQGYVTKLKPMLAHTRLARTQVPIINTFGFGHDMRSDLMQSIAEVGNGSYTFVNDVGMIGTSFVHAMANLCSTFASAAELEVKTADSTIFECSTVFNIEQPTRKTTVFQLGNIQYGQSRDLVIKSKTSSVRPKILSATLKYKCAIMDTSDAPTQQTISASPNGTIFDNCNPYQEYHVIRSLLCERLGALFPLTKNGEHKALSEFEQPGAFEAARTQMDSVVMLIKASPHSEDPNVASILADLIGKDSPGQISEALQTQGKVNFYRKWGQHYLPSLLHAHSKQACNSFKDPGPLRYGIDSPLFIRCRDEMDAAFENIPAPKPSRAQQRLHDGTFRPYTKIQNMSRYHSSRNPCFEGHCVVQLGDGSDLAVSKLRPGMQVWTPKGSRKIVAVVKTDPMPNPKDVLCRVGDLWVTPYHPISVSGQWIFPATVAAETKPCRAAVYSILLAFSKDSDAHVIKVAGQDATTLGHGVREQVEGSTDVRAHAFFGDYVKVVRSLMKLTKDKNGQLTSFGLEKSARSGLSCGFRAREDVKESVMKARIQRCRGGRARGFARYNLRAKRTISGAA